MDVRAGAARERSWSRSETGGWRTRLSAHWPFYLAEAGGLAAFMLAAGLLTIAFEHPASPLHAAGPGEVRRGLLGLCMAAVTALILYAPPVRRSGGHINPAVTWAFLRLGAISREDAVAYMAAQFAGSLIAPLALLAVFGTAFAHEAVDYSRTRPGEAGVWAAFWAEFAISFVLMGVVLIFVHSARLKPFTGLAAGALIGLYIAFESPLSGMSLNPARSFGSAVVAGKFDGLWLYFVAPPAAMLAAAELFALARRRGWMPAAEGPSHPERRSRSGADA